MTNAHHTDCSIINSKPHHITQQQIEPVLIKLQSDIRKTLQSISLFHVCLSYQPIWVKPSRNEHKKTPVSQRRLKQKRMKKNIITVLNNYFFLRNSCTWSDRTISSWKV